MEEKIRRLSTEEPVVPDTCRGGLRGGDDDDPDNLGQGRGNISAETKPNEVLMVENSRRMTCHEMFVREKYAVVRDEKCVVRSVVDTEDPGIHQGGRGEGVPDTGKPGGGEDRCSTSSSTKTKPNKVRGGLLASVQFWEMKSGKGMKNVQGKIVAGNTTDGEPRKVFGKPDRKQNQQLLKQQDQT